MNSVGFNLRFRWLSLERNLSHFLNRLFLIWWSVSLHQRSATHKCRCWWTCWECWRKFFSEFDVTASSLLHLSIRHCSISCNPHKMKFLLPLLLLHGPIFCIHWWWTWPNLLASTVQSCQPLTHWLQKLFLSLQHEVHDLSPSSDESPGKAKKKGGKTLYKLEWIAAAAKLRN